MQMSRIVGKQWHRSRGYPPPSPKPHTSALLPREHTCMHTKAPTLVWHRRILPSARRRSLLINAAGILPSHHSSKHTTHCSGAQGVHPKTCPVHLLTCSLRQKRASSSQMPHNRLALVAFGPREGVCLSGRRAPGHSGSGGLRELQALQRPSRSRLLLWPGQDGGTPQGGWLPLLHAHPSTMRPATGNVFAPGSAGP